MALRCKSAKCPSQLGSPAPIPAASWACGWTHRVLIARRLKKLEETIPVIYAVPFMGEQGWAFEGADTLLGTDYLWEVYVKARPDYTGRVSVPVLWDTETQTIVSNESSELMKMFDREFDEFGDASVRIFPEGLDEAIDAMLGPTGNLRAPTLRSGDTLLVGFNEEQFTSTLLG